MDIRTLFICLLMVDFFLGVFMLISLKTQKTYPGYSDWAASALLVFVVYLMFALRGIIPDFFSLIAANTLVTVVGLLRVSGINKFFNRPNNRFLYLTPFITFVLMYFCNIGGAKPFINLIIISIYLISISFYMALVYWKNIKKGSALLFGITIILLIIYSTMSAGRLLDWYIHPENANLLKSTFNNNIYFLLSIGIDILWATLFFTMNSFRLTAELEEANEKLYKINTTKNKFFSLIAHDLQGPVGNISQYLDQVITDYDNYSEEKKHFALDRLSASIKKTFTLLVNLLEWAKNQTGMIPFNPVELSIANAAEEVISLYSPNAHDKKITLVNSVPRELIIKADRHMFTTVLRNLLSNAVKFSNERGSIEISAEEKKGYVEVMFSDHGIGFPENDISNILNIDGFISSPGTANETGSGLGLIICKDFIEKHGGELRIILKEKGCDVIFSIKTA